MKYLSVCSGIEAATVAWHDLGWTPVGFSEIEPFPSAVLAHHFPEVPNLGDMTKYKEWPYERGSIDLLVGGTPCQAFSVAGLRKGLSDPRGNLALVYLGIADHLRPRWIVWENVPGVLSSSGGRDFGSLLGALAELGYGFAYRILDAQFFGVPQRRRRVFVVGYLGDWRPAAAVLFERESLRRDTPPSREKGKIVAALTANGVGTCGADDNQAQAGHLISYGIPGNWIGRKPENGGNATEPMIDIAPCLTKTDRHAVCAQVEYYENHGQDSRITGPHETAATSAAKYGTGGGNTPIIMRMTAFGQYSDDGTFSTCKARDYKDATDLVVTRNVRRLTPIECERLQGFPDNWTRIPWMTWQEANKKGTSYERLLNERGMKLREPTTEQCPDGPRYKAVGNSMAVPVMRWTGNRIKAVEQIIINAQQEASA